jgi:hypothetical protein
MQEMWILRKSRHLIGSYMQESGQRVSGEGKQGCHGGAPSWPTMLAWLGAAIAVAAGLAWLLIRPFLLPHR